MNNFKKLHVRILDLIYNIVQHILLYSFYSVIAFKLAEIRQNNSTTLYWK